jgi:hypothetical protein
MDNLLFHWPYRIGEIKVNQKVETPNFFQQTSSWVDTVRKTALGFVEASQPAFKPHQLSQFTPQRGSSRWQQAMRSLITAEAK